MVSRIREDPREVHVVVDVHAVPVAVLMPITIPGNGQITGAILTEDRKHILNVFLRHQVLHATDSIHLAGLSAEQALHECFDISYRYSQQALTMSKEYDSHLKG
ncbi:hypothetical protein [Xenorhabdus eapokensis]|uniref:hypothetical protein n=1 Tax=Xenorhabdus eapokensis TaxID=1873482 RepID=UPI000AB73FBD